jgi:hypothetical protein
MILRYEVSLFILRRVFDIKSCNMEPTALLPLRRKSRCELLSPLKYIALVEFEPVNLAFNGKHGNHYTIEDDNT